MSKIGLTETMQCNNSMVFDHSNPLKSNKKTINNKFVSDKMDPQVIFAALRTVEAMDSSSSSEDDDELLFLESILNEVCDTETHAKIRNYVDNVVSLYSDADVSILHLHLNLNF